MSEKKYIFVGGAARTGTTLLQSIICGLPGSSNFLPETLQIKFIFDLYFQIKNLEKRFDGAFFGGEEKVESVIKKLLLTMLDEMEPDSDSNFLVLKHPALTPLFDKLNNLLNSQAHYICIVRDPRDAIASMVRWGQRASKKGKYHWFSDRNISALSKYYLSFYGPIFKKNNYQRFTVIRYEDLVNSPEKTLSGFIDKIGIDINSVNSKKLINWGKVDLTQTGPVSDATSELYGKNISRKRIGAANEILSELELSQISSYCAEFNELYDYSTSIQKAKIIQPLNLETFTCLSEPIQPQINQNLELARNEVAKDLARLRDNLAIRDKDKRKLS